MRYRTELTWLAAIINTREWQLFRFLTLRKKKKSVSLKVSSLFSYNHSDNRVGVDPILFLRAKKPSDACGSSSQVLVSNAVRIRSKPGAMGDILI